MMIRFLLIGTENGRYHGEQLRLILDAVIDDGTNGNILHHAHLIFFTFQIVNRLSRQSDQIPKLLYAKSQHKPNLF